ncbi:hypothetical protein [Yinghuangia sp. YIM S09857]|uniref:hypothetical protein n=1 Tax=Yinghuangia sp. YIM S09857 TaxID=3436929 RepID=UPI003F529A92
MIIDSGVYVFDYRRFHDEVVPAIRQLHAGDVVEPWLEAVWNRGQPHPTAVPRFTPYLREITAGLMAAPDLSGALPAALFPEPVPRPKRRPRRAPGEAPPSIVDEYTLPPDHSAWLDVCHLFQRAVEENCLGSGAYMGNVTLPGALRFCVDSRGLLLGYDEDLRTLLGWLESRGNAWRQAAVDCYEGIYGWLDPDETWLLAEALANHPLPTVDATIPAIKAARTNGVGPCTDGESCPQRLAVLRAIAQLAVSEGWGLLWGLDVSPPDDKEFV